MILKQIVLSQESVNSDDAYDAIYCNIEFINNLLAEQVRYSEMCDDALKSYFVDYYLAQVNNGGFSQFVYNSGWDSGLLDFVEQGLQSMQATQHLTLLNKVKTQIANLNEKDFAEFLEGSYWDSENFIKSLDVLADEFYALNDKEDLIKLNSAWIKALPATKVLAEEALATEATHLADLITDKEQRFEEARANAPRFEKLIYALCEKLGQQLLTITAGDPTHEVEGEPTIAWHFLTEEGHFYMVDHNQVASIYEGEGDKFITSIPAGAEYGED